mmetsp:Transcript_48140/g.146413  ORF Transcript_48140/g.146413 Transcript_48140/m.146413 type:complete len:324 (+) Transcript_48140:984-1955(+)
MTQLITKMRSKLFHLASPEEQNRIGAAIKRSTNSRRNHTQKRSSAVSYAVVSNPAPWVRSSWMDDCNMCWALAPMYTALPRIMTKENILKQDVSTNCFTQLGVFLSTTVNEAYVTADALLRPREYSSLASSAAAARLGLARPWLAVTNMLILALAGPDVGPDWERGLLGSLSASLSGRSMATANFLGLSEQSDMKSLLTSSVMPSTASGGVRPDAGSEPSPASAFSASSASECNTCSCSGTAFLSCLGRSDEDSTMPFASHFDSKLPVALFLGSSESLLERFVHVLSGLLNHDRRHNGCSCPATMAMLFRCDTQGSGTEGTSF